MVNIKYENIMVNIIQQHILMNLYRRKFLLWESIAIDFDAWV